MFCIKINKMFYFDKNSVFYYTKYCSESNNRLYIYNNYICIFKITRSKYKSNIIQ